ncbi:MAG TPA: hypothetical protein DEQ38_05090 [Elusimicrobia bacterium]|nr:MAG: hypothetical protein A2089_01050 [Elusimicrobia bacterium GWD2_63_28]HCC47478.1 hypothetical protein [Elusimicrobiota bacterium]
MIKKLILAVAALSAWAGPALCAPAFELEPGVRLSSADLHCVRPISNGYRLYFSSQAAFSVYSATSADGENWTVEPGVRISTELAGFYSSSITALGAFEGAAIASGPYRAYYVGLSSTGIYSVLSATSTDGLTWGRDADFLLQFGSSRVLSLAPYFLGSGEALLYYARDDGSRDPASHRVYQATSTDSGNSFSGETQVLASTGVFNVAVSTLTNGTLRLFASGTLGAGATAAMVLAADSADGFSFPSAPAAVFSTAPAFNELGGIAVLRSTDTYSWRLYFTSTLNQAATDYVYSALTRSPVVTGFTPNLVYDNDGPTNFTVYGEIFQPGLNTAALAGAPGAIPVTSVTRVSDTQLTVATTPLGAALGLYSVSVTNPGGRSAGMSNVLRVDFRPGFTVLTDNLFRPLRGGSARVDITIYKAGDVKVDIYTINGGLVRKLFSGPAAVGTKTLFWDGKTDGGRTAASGLYLLHVTGPKLNGTEKIVLIK